MVNNLFFCNKGYRNGHKPGTLNTRAGRIDLMMPNMAGLLFVIPEKDL